MIALDTNVLARLLLGDDEAQLARIKNLLGQKQDFTAPVTVILELVWVLEAHGLEESDIETGIRLLLGLPNFEPAHASEIRQALSWYAQGMDMADALHLALCHAGPRLMTIDKRFIRTAASGGSATVVATVP